MERRIGTNCSLLDRYDAVGSDATFKGFIELLVGYGLEKLVTNCSF